jgi:hypothetical protein
LTLTSAIDFANGQGIFVLGAGALSTLNAPSCTAVAWGVGGSTTYNYQISAIDSLNGSSPASATCSATSAAATLNQVSTVNISTVSRLSGVVTVTTSAAHSFLVGGDVTILNVTDSAFVGAFRVESVADNTHFTYNQKGPDLSSSGGTASVASAVQFTITPSSPSTNVISYALYGRSGSTRARIRMISAVAGLANTFIAYDYGSTNAIFPQNIPSTAPGAATNGNLIAIIASGGGTASLSISPTTASATVASVTVQHDETAAINAALAAINGTAPNGGGRVRFPRGGTYNFGPLTWPTYNQNAIILEVEGILSPWTTIVMPRSYTKIEGGTQNAATPSFQKTNASLINNNGLSPVIWEQPGTTGIVISNITIRDFVGDAIMIGQNVGGSAPVSWTIEACNLAGSAVAGYGSAIYYAQFNGFGGSIIDGTYGAAANNPVPTFHMSGVAEIIIKGLRGGYGMTISTRGILFDAIGAPAGGDIFIEGVLTENCQDPYFLRLDNGSSTVTFVNINLKEIEIADPSGAGADMNLINWVYDNTAAVSPIGVVVDGARGWTVNMFNVNPGSSTILNVDGPVRSGSSSFPGNETGLAVYSGGLNISGILNRMGACVAVNNTTATVCPNTASGGGLWVKALTGQANDLFDVSDPNLTNYFKIASNGVATFGQAVILPSYILGGITQAQNSVPCSNVTPVTGNANVSTDQILMSCNISAGQLNSVGRILQVWTAFVYTTPVASVATINIKVKLCSVGGCGSGTVLTLGSWTSSANPGSVTNNSVNVNMESTTQTGGASAAYEAHGNMTIDLGASPGLADSIFSDTNTATIGTIDSTIALQLQITAAFSVASGSNSITERQLRVQLIN